MSRAVIVALMLVATPGLAQTAPAAPSDAATLVKTKSEAIITVEKPGKCPEVTGEDGIVVCAEIDRGEDQLIFDDQRVPESSAAQKQADAAACIPGTGCRPHPTGGVTFGFGKRRPPAIPYDEFLKGLPEPGSVAADAEGESDLPPKGPQETADFDPATLPPPLADPEP